MTKRAVLVTGDREWTDHNIVARELEPFPPGSFLIHGDADGVDAIAGAYGARRGLVVVKVPYLGTLGKRGGQARNGYMLKLLLGLQVVGYDVECIGFHANIAASKGTAGMLKLAEKKVPTRLVEA